MLIKRKSPISGLTRKLDISISQEDYDRWVKGEKLQNVCPDLTPEEREYIISGVHANEWGWVHVKYRPTLGEE
jgi:hypothetical protein